jgi:hypothetical protein
MRANLRRMDVPIEEFRYGLATHYHIDHAGLAQELKQAGVPLLVLDMQVPAIPLMKQWTKPQDKFTEITTHDNIVISLAESRSLLEQIGIQGEIIQSYTRRAILTTACRSCSTTALPSPATSLIRPWRRWKTRPSWPRAGRCCAS